MNALKSGSCIVLLLLLVLSGSPSSKAAGQEAPFYQGKTITLIVAAGAGGGFDTYARFFARHMRRFIPGNPNFVIQHMPGAGGLVAANTLYNKSARDGTVMAAFHRANAYEPLFSGRGDFDPRKFIWIGSLNKDTNLAISWHTSPATTFEDTFKQEIIIGATAAGADSFVYPHVLNELLGTKFKVVTGYETNEINMAMERGEIHGRVGAPWSHVKVVLKDWLASGKIKILLQMGLQPIQGLQAPMLLDYAKSDVHRKMLELLFVRQEAGRPYAFPPGVPAPLAELVRKAFIDMTNDAEFQREADKLGVLLDVMSGEDVQKLLIDAYRADPAIVEKVRHILDEGGQ